MQVPGVISYTQQQAEQQLNDRNLSPVVQTTNGPADTQGTVIRQNPTAQATVTPGADVTIVVNLGPKTAQIPTGITGLSAKDATNLIKEAGFQVVQKDATNEAPTDKKGTVVSVSPDQGATAPVGSPVTIYVATGQSSVPNLGGLTLAEAKTYASDQGFTDVVVGGRAGDHDRPRRARSSAKTRSPARWPCAPPRSRSISPRRRARPRPPRPRRRRRARRPRRARHPPPAEPHEHLGCGQPRPLSPPGSASAGGHRP